MTSLPVQNYNDLANNIVIKLINNTDIDYHKALIGGLFQMMETLFDEKKRGKQESFKSKILYKISYLLALIMYKTSDMGKIEILNIVVDMFKSNTKNEMIYILFQAIDGSMMRVKNTEKFGF